jgi:TonB family protein
VTSVPWNIALMQVLDQVNASAVITETEIRVTRRQAPTAPPLTGYMTVDKNIKPPEVLKRVNPVYTADAKAARISGMVIIETMIDETGVVRGTKILKRLPYGLDQAAADAVSQWTFAPALLDGKPVPVVFNLTVNFRASDTE